MRGFSLSESYTGEDDEAHQGLDVGARPYIIVVSRC
jgi:hypothetical protein